MKKVKEKGIEMGNIFKDYITVEDLQGYLDGFPEDTRIFFLDRRGEVISPAPKSTLDYHENIKYIVTDRDGNKKEIVGNMLAFVFDRE